MPTPSFTTIDPLASPHWRWKRACWLAERCPRISTCLGDRPTRRAFGYLRRLSLCQGNQERDAVRRNFADLATAHKIHRDDGNVRLELECRVLAGQSDEEIMEGMGLSMPEIGTYTTLFFDVRPRLRATDWITMCATGNKFVTETGEPDIGVIARQFAFFGGLPIMQMTLPRLLNGSALSDSPLDLSTAEGRSTMRVRLAVQTMTMPSDQKTAREQIKLWPRLLPYLAPPPEALTWDGVLTDKVAAMPEGMLQFAVTRTNREVRTVGPVVSGERATTIQSPEMAVERPSRLWAVDVA